MSRSGLRSEVAGARWFLSGILLAVVACGSPAQQDVMSEGTDVPQVGEVADLSSVEPNDVPPVFDADSMADLPLVDTHPTDAPVADGGDDAGDDDGVSHDGAGDDAPVPDAETEEVAEVPCQSADDCPLDEGCLDGLCGACASDGDCREGEECREGVCRNLACLTDEKCAFPGLHLICVDHHCEPCLSTYDCTGSAMYGGGFQCLGGECSNGNCAGNQDCPADLPVCGGDGTCRTCQNGSDECGEGYVCAEGTCEIGDCWIEGQVWQAGDTKPGNGCAVCLATLRLAWSPNIGVECNDEQACTHDDRCDAEVAGVCGGTPYECTPAPEIASCAQGVCHGTGPMDCTLEKKESWLGCLIDGGCYLSKADNPTNSCEFCNPETGGWSSKPLNLKCGACRACVESGERTVCDFVPDGQDPNNDCVQDCEACNGWGTCRWADADTDPNNDCQADAVATCGRSGLCEGGSDTCGHWMVSVGIDDGNECTTNDRCDGAGSKTGDAVANGTPCWANTYVCKQGHCGPCSHDGECAEGRVCSAGTCVVGSCTTPAQCGTPPACYRTTCKSFQCGLEPDDSVACTDGDPCTQNDYCLSGTCHGGTAVNCAALDTDCAYGACDPADGQCHLTPRDDGTTCTDGDPCTTESCQAGQCQATPKCLDDGLWCTTDCVNGGCAYARLENACLIAGTCFQHGDLKADAPCYECISTGGVAKPNDWSFDSSNACSDGIGCTVDVCQSGGCKSTESDALCDEGLPWRFAECDSTLPGCVERGWAYVAGPDVYAADAVTTAEGDVLLVGYFYGEVDFDPGPAEDLHYSGGKNGLFVTKIGKEGGYRWTRTCAAQGTGFAQAESLAVSPGGDLLITGKFTGTADFDPSATASVLKTSNSFDVFVLRLSSAGAYLGVTTMGAGGNDGGEFVRTYPDGSFVVTGYFGGTVDFDASSATHALTEDANEENRFFAKYDASGGFVWIAGLMGGSHDVGDVVATPDGGLLVGGLFTSGTDFDAGSAVYSLSTTALGEGFVLKLTAAGTLEWVKEFDITGAGLSFVRDLLLLDDGGVLATGDYRATVDLDPGAGQALYSTGGTDWSNARPFLVELSATGALRRAQGYGIRGNEGRDLARSGGGTALLSYGYSRVVTITIVTDDLNPASQKDVLTNSQSNGEIEPQRLFLIDGGAAVTGHFKRGFDLDPSSLVYKPGADTDIRHSFVYATDMSYTGP